MIKGRVTDWNDAKGYGFITPINGGKKIFFHVSDYPRGSSRPSVGQVLFFVVVADARGDKAVGIKLSQSNPARVSPSPMRRAHLTVSVFVLVLVALATTAVIPWWIAGTYGVTSLFAFFAYGWDKASAKLGKWRTQEQTLQMLSLLGGWPGALIAQEYFKHKTRKKSFQIIFWSVAGLNCIGLVVIAHFGIGTVVAWFSR